MSLSRSATWTQRPGSPRKEVRRLPGVVEPADALLPLDRHPGRVDLALERRGPPELRPRPDLRGGDAERDRKSTRLNSSHANISYAVFCLKKKKHRSLLTSPT